LDLKSWYPSLLLTDSRGDHVQQVGECFASMGFRVKAEAKD
jgi:hypothetical protein